ncbi:neutral zinc metallopeptidase [Streptosporangium sp. NPDC005286]|uniref:neutral zinc metallopeptidase n=1 Tax=Streptosporangium sp. NPDC005286 TaxID=3154463 RepID=UPI0033AD15DF
MRTPRIVLLAGALVGLLLTGTAHANVGTARTAGGPVPTGSKALTHNPLYRSGKMTVPCGRHPDDFASFGAAKKHLTAMLGCLNASWSAQLKKAGLPFKKPAIQFLTKSTSACEERWPEYVVGLYCPDQRKMVIRVNDYAIQDPADPDLLLLIAHEYAHHVQNLTGILATAQTPVRTKAKALERSRRVELQAECLAGAFMASIWPSQQYTAEDWAEAVDILGRSGDEEIGAERTHGTSRNRAAWLQRGFDKASPGACNTWTATASSVA